MPSRALHRTRPSQEPRDGWWRWCCRPRNLAFLLVLLACLIVVVWDWQELAIRLVVGILLALSIASLVYLPAFCYYLLRTQSLRLAWARAWEVWIRVALEVLDKIP